jgi:hypothetical protein
MHGILQILFPSLLEIEAPKVSSFYKRVSPPDNTAAYGSSHWLVPIQTAASTEVTRGSVTMLAAKLITEARSGFETVLADRDLTVTVPTSANIEKQSI